MAGDLAGTEIERIRAEYERRARTIPRDFYSWQHPVNLFFHTQLCRAAIAGLAGRGLFPLNGRAVADIGCGAGTWLLEFAQWGAASLAGIDLDEERVGLARSRLPFADLHAGDASRLPWPGQAFDLVTQFTLFTSILDEPLRRAIAAEMLRVLRPGGVVLWYDFRVNNPRNPHVRGIRAAEIRSLFPGCETRLHPVTLAPPLARAIVPWCWPGALVLEALPFLCTHYLGIISCPNGTRT